MRRVDGPEALEAALADGSAEADAAFGDGAVYLEREIRPARHIEVQLLGDQAGQVVALGERDCSIQRRHQKLVEEAPAAGLSSSQRASLHELAVRLGSAAGLTNAATAEFLLDEAGRFWFLEVNARLQVEHGVTELVSGVDIVAEQLWLASGAGLSPAVLAAAERAEAPSGHAIEVRISQEDPAHGFSSDQRSDRTLPAGLGPWGPGRHRDRAGGSGAARLRPAPGQADGPCRRPAGRDRAASAGARRDRHRRGPDHPALPPIRSPQPGLRVGRAVHRLRGRSLGRAGQPGQPVRRPRPGPARSRPGRGRCGRGRFSQFHGAGPPAGPRQEAQSSLGLAGCRHR